MSRVAPYLDQPDPRSDFDPTIGGAATTAGSANGASSESPPSTLQMILIGLQERLKHAEKLASQFGEYVGHLLRVRADKAMLAIRTALIWAIVGAAAGMMGLAAVVYATVLLLSGIAGGLGALFGGRLWLGELLTGLIVASTILIGAFMVARSLIGKGEKALHAKYEAIRKSQREKYGRDVQEAAAAE